MLFGIALCTEGPLAEPAAVLASAKAAEVLGYASVWSTSLQQLIEVTGHTDRIPLGLLISRPGRYALLDHEVDPAWPARTDRLAFIGVPDLEGLVRRPPLPPHCLLDTADVPQISALADGWAPRAGTDQERCVQWRRAHPGRPLLLRVHGTPTTRDLHWACEVRVTQMVVALPNTMSLDEQLAGFAEIAERVLATQTAG